MKCLKDGDQNSKYYWLAITLKESAKLDKKPILLKVEESFIKEIISELKVNAKNENYLFHLADKYSDIFFFSKDIYFIKISPVKFNDDDDDDEKNDFEWSAVEVN